MTTTTLDDVMGDALDDFVTSAVRRQIPSLRSDRRGTDQTRVANRATWPAIVPHSLPSRCAGSKCTA